MIFLLIEFMDGEKELVEANLVKFDIWGLSTRLSGDDKYDAMYPWHTIRKVSRIEPIVGEEPGD